MRHICMIKIEVPLIKRDKPSSSPVIPYLQRKWGPLDFHSIEVYFFLDFGHNNLV